MPIITGLEERQKKMSDTNQICFMEVDGKIVFFNEAEAVSDLDVNEPEELEINALHDRRRIKR